MAKVSMRIEHNSKGFAALMKSNSVMSDIEARGARIAAAAGEGFEVNSTRNRDRSVVFVRTETTEARRAEAEDRALTRAIDAGR